MPEQAKSISYGDSNVGEAVVFDRESPNLFNLLDKQEAKKERKVAKIDAQKAVKQKKFDDMMKYSAPEFWHPANAEIQEKVNAQLAYVASAKKSGMDLNSPEFTEQYNKNRVEVEMLANKSNEHKASWLKFIDGAKDIPGLNMSYLNAKLEESTLDDNGNKMSVIDWKSTDYQKLLEDPTLYDKSAVMDGMVEKLGKNTVSEISSRGLSDVITSGEFPSWFEVGYDKNGKSEIVRNEDGSPKINVTPELVERITGSTGGKAIVKQMVDEQHSKGNDMYDESDAVKQLLEPYSKGEIKKTLKGSAGRIAKYKNQFKSGQEKKGANTFLEPYANLMQGADISYKNKKMVTINGVSQLALVSNPPFGNNVFGMGEDGKTPKTVEYFAKDSNGDVWVKKSNKDELELFDKDNTDILTGFINYSKNLSKEEKQAIFKVLDENTILNEDGTQSHIWEEQALKREKAKLVTKKEDYDKSFEVIMDNILNKEEGFVFNTASDLNTKMNKKFARYKGETFMIEGKPYSNITFKLDKDKGTQESEVWVTKKDNNGNEIEVRLQDELGGKNSKYGDLFEDIDNEDVDELIQAIKVITKGSIKQKEKGTKLGAGKDGGVGTRHGNASKYNKKI